MMKIFFVALIVIFVHKTKAIHECCSGENSYYINSLNRCSDNSTINLTCNEKEVPIIINSNELPPYYSILDNNGTLIDSSNAAEPARVE